MKQIHAGIHERLKEARERLFGVRKARRVVLLLPLRPSKNNREVFSDLGATGGDELCNKLTAPCHGAAVGIVTLIGAFPQKLIQQITVRTVYFDRVKTNGL